MKMSGCVARFAGFAMVVPTCGGFMGLLAATERERAGAKEGARERKRAQESQEVLVARSRAAGQR
jgi:hypothetical protein